MSEALTAYDVYTIKITDVTREHLRNLVVFMYLFKLNVISDLLVLKAQSRFIFNEMP
jgi:hypothetical protein